jgi:superfamily II DNA or RNA helicase
LFVTPDTGLREQVYNDYLNWFGPHNVSTDITSDKPIIVSNIQALAKKDDELFKRFGMLVIDEFHHSSASTYLDLNKACENAYYRYGFTGTFIRSDGVDMPMHGVLSNVIFRKTTSELIEEGFLVRPYITVKEVVIPKSKAPYAEAYAAMTEYIPFNEVVADICRTKVAEGKQTLVLVRRKEHGRLLASMIPGALFVSGSDKGKERAEIKRNFITKKLRCMVATEIFGEGQDIPSIDVLVNARLQKTEIQTAQGIGRALRKAEGKDKAEVFDFLIVGQRHLHDHSVQRIASYKKESAFVLQILREPK